MAIAVGADESTPTHDIKLVDVNSNEVGLILCDSAGRRNSLAIKQDPRPRTPLRTSQGQVGYGDFELPYLQIGQESWLGGRGSLIFENDKSRYSDSLHCDTTHGDILCGPKVTGTLGENTEYGDPSYDGQLVSLGRVTQYFASPFTPATSLTPQSVELPYASGHSCVVYIYSSTGSAPNSVLTTATCSQKAGETSDGPGSVYGNFGTQVTLSAGTEYWLVYRHGGGYIPYRAPEADADILASPTGAGSWATFTDDGGTSSENKVLPFLLYGYTGIVTTDVKFFLYKRALYAIQNDPAGGAPALYMNGYRGVSSTNTTDLHFINIETVAESVDLRGCICLIIAGPGSEERQPWRYIISNTTTRAYVSPPWEADHSADTQYVILNSDDWTEITGHGLTKRVESIVNMDGYVIFSQGPDTNMRKFQGSDGGASWSNAFRDDGTNKADLLLRIQDTEGDVYLWKAIKSTGVIQKAAEVAYGSNHSFSTVETIPDINSMIAYGNPLIPYVFTETGFGSIQNDIYAEIPSEVYALRSETVGEAAMRLGVYLYFNIDFRIERYYEQRLDDVGPNRDEGLPKQRLGNCVKLLPYPGRYYAAYSAPGTTPAIFCHNGVGWHEIFRQTGSTLSGDAIPTTVSYGQISDMIIQVIPGRFQDRLWFNISGSLLYVPVAINPYHESKQDDYVSKLDIATAYQFESGSEIETGWITAGLPEINKFWKSVILQSEGLSNDINVQLAYKVDDDTDWTSLGSGVNDIFNTSPSQERDLSATNAVYGKRIKFKFTLNTNDSYKSPRVIAMVAKAVLRMPVKQSWYLTFLANPKTDLQGRPLGDDQGTVLSQLDTWANSDDHATPLTMSANVSPYDQKTVFIDPATVQISRVEVTRNTKSKEREYEQICRMLVYEA